MNTTDFVYKLVNGTYAVVEYKSRHGSVYESDIHQLLATVLAVRTEFNTSRASVTTAKVTEEIHLTSSRKILRRLNPLFKEKVRIDSGWLPPKLTDKTKCRNCAFKAHCGR